MIRKRAKDENHLYYTYTELELDEISDFVKDYGETYMGDIGEEMRNKDREEAWEEFMADLKDSMYVLFENDFLGKVTWELTNEFDDFVNRNSFLGLWAILRDYVTDALHDVFINYEASDMEEVWRANGDDFIGRLERLLKGKHITVSFDLNAGGIE